MSRRVPIMATLIVATAVALLIGLGVWQLGRAKENEAVLTRYKAATRLAPISFPTLPLRDEDLPLYRYTTGNCLRPVGQHTAPGENHAGEPGFLVIIDCATGVEGPGMSVEVGWSKNPRAKTSWAGGLVSGLIVRDDRARIRLVAATPAPGLEASAPPQPTVRVMPWRNQVYAVIWFSLAATALVIYGLAVRQCLKPDTNKQ